ncbi:MAG: hypothetical protein ACTSVY_06240 [Candidatus Helarchaeota archaeon]
MGFGKAFGAGIAIYIGFNVLITFLSVILMGLQIGDIATTFQAFLSNLQSDPVSIILMMLAGYIYPSMAIQMMPMGTVIATGIPYFYTLSIFSGLVFVLVIVFNIVAAVIIGYLSHNPTSGFGAWFLVSTIGAIVGLIGYTYMFGSLFLSMLMIFLPTAVTAIVVNGLAYGAIAMGMGYRYEE